MRRAAAKLTAAAARLQKAEKIVLLAMAAAAGDLAFQPLKMCRLLVTTVQGPKSRNCLGFKIFPSGCSSSVRPTRRAAILEELAAAAGEEGAGDDETELIAGENLEFDLHQKLFESRVE